MAFRFSVRSVRNSVGVHPDLQRVAILALRYTTVDFGISEGIRDIKTQKKYVKLGVSRTMRSRHLTGHAIDVYAWVGQVRWEMPLYVEIAKAFRRASRELDVPITWGGSWRRFKDGPHFQLQWKAYPAIKQDRA